VLEPDDAAQPGQVALTARLEQGFAETGPVTWTGDAGADVTQVQIAGSVSALIEVTDAPPPEPEPPEPPFENFP
jgi:hypothetical protein